MTKTLVVQYEEARARYFRSFMKHPKSALTIRLRYRMEDLMHRCLQDYNRKRAA